ncbi:class I tRNA ligase family protein, partial [Streptomyces sp. NPDC059900]|uniref:class I tRNA ligase family protein n=1 Tax=Streptomyces sp. NPDC059900 TaxID=3155816 RepID=UPI003D014D47
QAEGDGGGAGTESARVALRTVLDELLRLLAPVLPFVTEEVWSWYERGSVHRAAWPVPEIPAGADAGVLATASEAITAIRRAKSEARLSMRAPVAGVVVSGPRASLDRFELARADVRAAGRVAAVELREAQAPLGIEVRL